jgi:hypothetical protein
MNTISAHGQSDSLQLVLAIFSGLNGASAFHLVNAVTGEVVFQQLHANLGPAMSVDPNSSVLKIAVHADGRITVDGSPTTIDSL